MLVYQAEQFRLLLGAENFVDGKSSCREVLNGLCIESAEAGVQLQCCSNGFGTIETVRPEQCIAIHVGKWLHRGAMLKLAGLGPDALPVALQGLLQRIELTECRRQRP